MSKSKEDLAALIAGDGITTREQAGVAADAVRKAGWVSPRVHRAETERADDNARRLREAMGALGALRGKVETLKSRWLRRGESITAPTWQNAARELDAAFKPDHVAEADALRKQVEG